MGRALGYGTRHLAKTLAAVAEAASTPSSPPAGIKAGPDAEPGTAPNTPSRVFVESPSRSASLNHATAPASPGKSPLRARSTGPTVRQLEVGSEHLKQSLLRPLAAYSRALWLRVTGTFFTLLAVTVGMGAWRARPDLHLNGSLGAAHHLWIFMAFGGLFGYFAVSSFLRANQVERNVARRT